MRCREGFRAPSRLLRARESAAGSRAANYAFANDMSRDRSPEMASQSTRAAEAKARRDGLARALRGVHAPVVMVVATEAASAACARNGLDFAAMIRCECGHACAASVRVRACAWGTAPSVCRARRGLHARLAAA